MSLKHYIQLLFLRALTFVIALGFLSHLKLQAEQLKVTARYKFTLDDRLLSSSAISGLNQPANGYIDPSLEAPQVLARAITKHQTIYHFFSHGKAGQLFINGKWLEKEDIATFIANELNAQCKSFSKINIYGCDFGAGDEGKTALDYLEQLLGLPIQASTNLTGKNGDWTLEIGEFSLDKVAYPYSLQLDTVHYLPPFVGGEYNSGDFSEEEVIITTNSGAAISVTITSGDGTPIAGSPFSVVKGTPVILNFTGYESSGPPTTSLLAQPRAGLGTKYVGKGLIFTSADDFSVSYRSRGSFQAESLSAKGIKAKGRHFKWAVPRGFYGQPSVHSYMSILAVETSTITISGINPATEITGVTHSGSINITLNAGESVIYEVKPSIFPYAGSANVDGHVGADIVSSGDVVINTGGQNAQFLQNEVISNANDRDHAIDQIIPIEFLGNEYIIIQGNGGTFEKVFVTATANNTEIYLNGDASAAAVLNEGQQFIFTGTTHWAGKTMYLVTAQPVYVQHVLQGRDSTFIQTQGMNFISPLSCFAATEIDEIGKVGSIGNINYSASKIILIETVGATTSATENGVPVTLPAPIAVAGNSQYQIREFSSLTAGSNWSLLSNAAIFAYVFGSDFQNAGYASYVSGFPDIPNVSINGNTTSCGNNTFQVSSGPWTAYQWYKDGVAIPGATNDTFFATDPAQYSVEVFVNTGSSCSQFSSTAVNPCPGISVTNARISGPSPVTNIGDVLSYQVTVENTGNVILTNYNAIFTLSDNSTITLINPNGDTDNDGLIDPGETWVYSVTDTVTRLQYEAGATLTTTASVVTTEIPGPSTAAETTEVFNRPTNLVATKAGNGDIEVSFTPGTDGGSPITNYEYSTDGGDNWTAFNPEITSSPVLISGLTGNKIVIQLRAVNALTVSAASDSVIVPGGVIVVLNGGDVEGTRWTYANGTISPNSSVDVNLNVSDLLNKLSSPLTVEGLFVTINTPIEYTGSNALTLYAIKGDITINESVDVKALTLNGKGVVASGKFINADGNFTHTDSLILKTGLSGFSQLRFTGSYTGTNLVKIEQEIAGVGWHNLANPFANQTASSFGLVGTDRHPNAENLRRWNADVPYIWENINAGSHNLDPGRGYLGYFGNHPQGWEGGLQVGTGPWTLTVAGEPLTSTSYELLHYKKIQNTTWEGFDDPNETDGWNLVANPFTAVLDFSEVTRPDNVNNAFYIWDPSKSGGAGYVSWSGAGITNPWIAPLQSYWVQTTPSFDNNGGASRNWNLNMVVHTNVKTASLPEFFKTQSLDFDRIVLQTKHADSTSWADHTVIALIDEATDDYDGEWDARKWINPGTACNIYSVVGSNRFAVNAISHAMTNNVHKTVPINFSSGTSGTFEIALDEQWLVNPLFLVLEDLYTGQFHDLKTAGSFRFKNTSEDPNRFLLHISFTPLDLTEPTPPIAFWVSNQTAHLQVNHYEGTAAVFITDMTGRDIWLARNLYFYPGQKLEFQLNLQKAHGAYLFKVLLDDAIYTTKFVH